MSTDPSTPPVNNDLDEQKKPKKTPKLLKERPKRQLAKIYDPNMSATKQTTLASYFSTISASTSNQAASTDPEQTKLNELKQELITKERQLIATREQKQFYENKYSVTYMEYKNYKHKARHILVKTLNQNAETKRQERRKVDMRLGFFDKDMKFIEGDDIREIHNTILEKKEEQAELQQTLPRCKSDQQKDRIKFAISFIKKQVSSRETALKNKFKQLRSYRDRLKLGMQQLSCQYEQQKWRIVKDSHDNDRYVPLMLIGKGGFGEVYKCYDLEANQFVAIKINNIRSIGVRTQNHLIDQVDNKNGAKQLQKQPQEQAKIKIDKNNEKQRQRQQQQANFILKHVQREVRTQKQLKHPNIVQIRQILEMNPNRVVFVLEYCSGPELSTYLKQRGSLQEQQAKKIIHSILCALNYMSSLDPKVIHYDLKPSNIIFDRGVVKVLDFGLCKLMDSGDSKMELTSQGVGTYWYLPPETFRNRETPPTISNNVDVWSTGIIFYELLYGVRPYGRGKSQQKIMNEDIITRESKQLKNSLFNLESPNRYRISKEVKAFIGECLCANPEKRLSVEEAYNHSYFK